MKPSARFEQIHGDPPTSPQVRSLLQLLDELFPERPPTQARLDLERAFPDREWRRLDDVVGLYRNHSSARSSLGYGARFGLLEVELDEKGQRWRRIVPYLDGRPLEPLPEEVTEAVGESERFKRERVLLVECPACGARPGDPCREIATGDPLEILHALRVLDAYGRHGEGANPVT